jgi:predicted AlkP superfamily phosphohydrolase/phosphomutase
MDRRRFLQSAATAVAGGALYGLAGARGGSKRAIILGFDGMDPRLVKGLMDAGELPAFSRLARTGGFWPLGTSLPPQSPVAWASFITGANPGQHGIFDFVHRDPETYLPYLSTSTTKGAARVLKLGKLRLPLQGGSVDLMRRGTAYWEVLEEQGIPATLARVPSNFPPSPTNQRTLSGMGTPDILGSYGTFTFYTTEPFKLKPDISGGRVVGVTVRDNIVRTVLSGPKNDFIEGKPELTLDVTAYLDPERPAAKLVVGDAEFLLRQGEWSEWVPIRFPVLRGLQSVSGICRFYLKEIRPEFKLYVSPINLDPRNPALPISTPPSYARELADEIGLFYTQGLPGDTHALDHGLFDEEEYLEQSRIILEERLRLSEYELGRFDQGSLFLYFSNTDQDSHMFWRLLDRDHPIYDADLAARYGDTFRKVYRSMDGVVNRALDLADEDTLLLAVSDHGFASYRRALHLNTWLEKEGYAVLKNPADREPEFLANVDWSRTRAYALGLNGLYLNVRGREREGIVSAGREKEALEDELAAKLQGLKDPKTGETVVSQAYVARKSYRGPHMERAPDIVVGYAAGHRASWQTALGKFPRELLADNLEKWSGDHCGDPQAVPGVLFSNSKLRGARGRFIDLAPTILAHFEAPIPDGMDGTSLLST